MIIIIELLFMILRVVFRHAAFNELRRTLNRNNDISQNKYERSIPKPKVSPLQAMLDNSNQSIQKFPKDAAGYCDRGATFILLKQFDDAVVDLNKAIVLQPSCADAFNKRAILHYHKNDFVQAITDFSTAITFDSNDAYYYLNRAMVYKRLEDNPKAEADVERALDLNLKLVDVADKANLKQNVVDENIIWNRQLAHLVFVKTELLFLKYDHREHLDNITADK